MSKKRILILNKTKGTTIGYAKLADTFFSRFKGLMLKRKLEEGLVLKLPSGRGRKGSAIHMFFMLMPLDVLFVDSNMEIVDLIHIHPWKTYTPISPAKYIIELEGGTIINSKTEIGDEIDFTCEGA